jgi:hypothetical protein
MGQSVEIDKKINNKKPTFIFKGLSINFHTKSML